MEEHDLAALIGMLPQARRSAVNAFFQRWPGHDSGNGLGLGRAVVDFQEWEIRSGRIAANGGSSWWAVVNGMLVADVADAADAAGIEGDSGEAGACAWRTYTEIATAAPGTIEAQRAMWRAHQVSVDRGAAAAAPLLALEPEAEQRFARIVLSVVKDAARRDTDTTTDHLARLVARHYPKGYPADGKTVDELIERLSDLGGAQSGSR